MIDTATELWDPPPPRPSLAPAWIGASLSSAMILALLAAGGVVAHAWNDERYRETADTCSRLDITAVATRLGDPTLRPQPSRTPGACAYVVQDENGLWNGYGSVQVDYTPNAVGAWLAWRNRQAEDNPQQVPDLGRAARLTTQARNVRGEDVCSASLDVLDSNLLFRTGIATDADIPSRPCDDLDALSDALIESARTSLARLAESP